MCILTLYLDPGRNGLPEDDWHPTTKILRLRVADLTDEW